MTKGKKILTILAVIIVLLVSAFIWLGWSGSTKDIEAVADQFKPDNSWVLKTKSITPPRTVCLEGTCPELTKVWLTTKPVTKEEILNLLNISSWNKVKLEDPNCFEALSTATNNLSCLVEGKTGKYNVQIYVNNNDTIYRAPSLTLFVRE